MMQPCLLHPRVWATHPTKEIVNPVSCARVSSLWCGRRSVSSQSRLPLTGGRASGQRQRQRRRVPGFQGTLPSSRLCGVAAAAGGWHRGGYLLAVDEPGEDHPEDNVHPGERDHQRLPPTAVYTRRSAAVCTTGRWGAPHPPRCAPCAELPPAALLPVLICPVSFPAPACPPVRPAQLLPPAAPGGARRGERAGGQLSGLHTDRVGEGQGREHEDGVKQHLQEVIGAINHVGSL